MATMSLQPLKIEVSDWEIIQVGEEIVQPCDSSGFEHQGT